jgi:predicted amino acid-binding ACT domain protein
MGKILPALFWMMMLYKIKKATKKYSQVRKDVSKTMIKLVQPN